jgi:acyl-coenzyme A synthetase/AMP-(fatty) acid ligase
VALGYHDRRAETASRFVEDPWGEAPGSRWYRSGDVAARSPEGYVFLGRDDAQVKVRGHRIEPAAIEAAAVRLPEVHQAAALAVGGVTGAHDAVWLFVVAPQGADAATVRSRLAGLLPYFMVPDRVIVRAEPLPLTVNGKLDRASLLAGARSLRAPSPG